MSENQFATIVAEIHSLKSEMNAKFDGVDARFNNVEKELTNINGELKKIESVTRYNANQDIIDKVTALRGY
jgi:hypothetical protein